MAGVDGSGYGYGSGSGSGYGSGSGSGSGDGSGDGYGYGYGSGAGYGYGDGYWRAAASELINKFATHSEFLALWWSDKNRKPTNGGSSKAIQVGDVQEVQGPLELCGQRALHATLKPEKWKGDRLWLVALYGKVLHDGDKCGALKREILAEIKIAPD